MANIGWSDFLTAVQIQLTGLVTYAYSHNPIFQVTYDLRPYGVTDWDGVTGRLTGNFLTDAGDFGSLWRRFPSNGAQAKYHLWQNHPDHSSFEAFALTKTDLHLFSIAPNTITSDITASSFGYFGANGEWEPYSSANVFRKIVEAKLGVKLSGNTSTGRTHTTAGGGSLGHTLVDKGLIQEYCATHELNLGFGGATDLGTGTSDTSPYFDTGDGLAVQSRSYTDKRDKIW